MREVAFKTICLIQTYHQLNCSTKLLCSYLTYLLAIVCVGSIVQTVPFIVSPCTADVPAEWGFSVSRDIIKGTSHNTHSQRNYTKSRFWHIYGYLKFSNFRLNVMQHSYCGQAPHTHMHTRTRNTHMHQKFLKVTEDAASSTLHQLHRTNTAQH